MKDAAIEMLALVDVDVLRVALEQARDDLRLRFPNSVDEGAYYSTYLFLDDELMSVLSRQPFSPVNYPFRFVQPANSLGAIVYCRLSIPHYWTTPTTFGRSLLRSSS